METDPSLENKLEFLFSSQKLGVLANRACHIKLREDVSLVGIEAL